MPMYIKDTKISPLYNGEMNASVLKDTKISPLYNGEVNASLFKGHQNLAVVQRRGKCFGI